MAVSLGSQAQRLKKIAETIVLQDKPHRQALIIEMKALIREIPQTELIEVIRQINSPVAFNFLIPAGVYGEARELLYLKLSNLAKAK